MSDIFENDIDDESLDIEALEKAAMEDESEAESQDSEDFVYPSPLFRLKLEYSCEGVYATLKDGMKELEAGSFVIIPTRYGKDLARVMGKVNVPVGIKASDVITVERIATEADLEHARELKEKEAEAFKVFKEKVKAHNLAMKLITTHFLVDEQKVLFFFSSDNRVDFRELVKDLVSVFKMRIELRQVGVRDESRITGGLGVCGRPYCCHAVSDKLKPVSIRMAKDQNLSLNSMKISGLCGRLLCCLAYEYNWYAEARKKLPSEGVTVFYDGTKFRITEINFISSMIKMSGDDGRIIEVNANRFYKDNNYWKIN
ncbi:MAG: hypothetical protein K5640_07675 [Treponema sp.]|nr:hypothetical protein [Treponema sp.]